MISLKLLYLHVLDAQVCLTVLTVPLIIKYKNANILSSKTLIFFKSLLIIQQGKMNKNES